MSGAMAAGDNLVLVLVEEGAGADFRITRTTSPVGRMSAGDVMRNASHHILTSFYILSALS